MFEIHRQIELDAGHRVPYHASKCKHLHGHRYKVIAHVTAEETVPPDPRRSDSGMVTDFGVIKQVLMEKIHDKFDHRFILWEQDPFLQDIFSDVVAKESGIITIPCIPTAEELARYWGYIAAEQLDALGEGSYWLSALEVWETPNSVAFYRPPK